MRGDEARSARRIPPRILVTRFVGGAWTEPEPAPFSEEGDEAPFLSRDGRRLVFTSRRAMPGTYDRSENLWMVERRERGWSEPVPLPEAVNRPEREIDEVDVGSEFGPLVLEGGVLLFTATADPDWGDRLLEPPKVVRVNALDDSAVTLKVLGQTRAAQQWAVAGELRKRILEAFGREGIEIPYPHRVVVSRGSGDPEAEAAAASD